jgi:hypothetical protein
MYILFGKGRHRRDDESGLILFDFGSGLSIFGG